MYSNFRWLYEEARNLPRRHLEHAQQQHERVAPGVAHGADRRSARLLLAGCGHEAGEVARGGSRATASTTRSSRPTLGSSRTSTTATRSSSLASAAARTRPGASGLISKCGILKLGARSQSNSFYTRYRVYVAPTIRALLAKPLPQDASLEERWLTKYSRPTKIRFVGVWDTVGSMGIPHSSAEAKVHKYRFLDTHLRLDNECAFHALALDEHREDFDATFWTRPSRPGRRELPTARSRTSSSAGSSARTRTSAAGMRATRCRNGRLSGSWRKPGARAAFREQVVVDETQTAPTINNSYREFGNGFYHFFSRPFYRSGGRRAPDRIGSDDVAHQRDDRWLGVRSLAHRCVVPPGEPGCVGGGEAGRSRQAIRRGHGERTQGRRGVTLDIPQDGRDEGTTAQNGERGAGVVPRARSCVEPGKCALEARRSSSPTATRTIR